MGSYRGDFFGMKAVGVKVLKNNLRRYMKEVQSGETIFVTDRDEVIAEMNRPIVPVPGKLSRWAAWVHAQARAGKIREAGGRGRSLREARVQAPRGVRFDVTRFLDETRGERL